MLLRIFGAMATIAAFALPCSMSFFKAEYRKNPRSDTALFRFEKNGKAGFINAQGNVVIPPRFDIGWFSEEDFVEGLSPAREGQNWGFIESNGNWVIPPQFWRVEPFSEGLAAVFLNGSRLAAAYIDRAGRIFAEFPGGLAEAGPFSEGLAAVRVNGYSSVGKLGYIDRSGSVVIPYQFAVGGPFREGLAAVVLDGQCFVQGREGTGVSTPPSVMAATSCGGVPDGITKPCGEGFINRAGKVVFRFDAASDFSEGLAAVQEGSGWGFIEPSGAFRVKPRFEAAHPFHDGLAAVPRAGKWGYIDQGGNWVVAPQFLRAQDFSDDLALTDRGYIDKTGKRVAAARNGTAFVQGLAHVDLGGGSFGYINHQGKVIFRYHTDVVKPRMLPYSDRAL